MPGIDWIPGVSHVKCLVQAATGDTEGAKKTLENFCRECPGVSQVTSVIQLAAGDKEGALETQKKCWGTVSNVTNGIPVIGHAKGLVHHAVGDHEGGNQAFNAATRSTVVVASGAAAGIATGGIGAIPAGIAAGVGYDASASAITGENQGYIAAFKNAADNPSAGSFIDALAIPVGDGLAGYSGGQIANKLRSNNGAGISKSNSGKPPPTGSELLKLKELDTARLAKLDQMNAAGTDGAAMQFAQEANAITAEMSAIERGTPVFWDNPKSGTVVSEASSSNVPIPVAGYVDENNQSEATKISDPIIARVAEVVTSSIQEDALHHDSYVATVVIENKNERPEAQKKLRDQDKQKTRGDILQTYRDVQFTTPKALSDLLDSINEDPNRDPNRNPNNNLRECVNQLLRWAWLLLIMPKEFSYTVIAQLNSPYVGLYHSFIRHIDDWRQVLPSDLNPLIDRLSPLMTEITAVASANNALDAAEARDSFIEARRQLNSETSNDVQTALVEIQMSMLRFIQDNITFENYRGRSCNMNGGERLYFRVVTGGVTRFMVLCLADERFEPRTGDNRPIRRLITMYFESLEVFNSHGLLETKEEMQRK